jgi:RHH-type proline utilization regulon transcriptional repressor/proline dehydrogenase/delta 1-pyrroline-5-carboxylate dehydrogenase
MAAHGLDEAIAVQNAVPYGLTGGIRALDPAHVQRWLERVEVGNAYVNRAVTSAIVGRQPFGGWKRSVIGPGAKAGGPNYVAQLGRWRPARDPERGEDLSPRVAALVRSLASELEPAERVSLEHAARSDARVAHRIRRRPRSERPLLRKQRVPPPCVADDRRSGRGRRQTVDVARVLAAATLVDAPLHVSTAPAYVGPLGRVARRDENAEDFVAWARCALPDRVRLLGDEPALRTRLPPTTFLDDRPPIGDGRIELLRYLREQAVSRTLHRFGNLVSSARSPNGD